MILFYIFLAIIAAFGILFLLMFIDIINGLFRGKKTNFAEGFATIMEAIFGMLAAAGGVVLLAVFGLLMLFFVFSAII